MLASGQVKSCGLAAAAAAGSNCKSSGSSVRAVVAHLPSHKGLAVARPSSLRAAALLRGSRSAQRTSGAAGRDATNTRKVRAGTDAGCSGTE